MLVVKQYIGEMKTYLDHFHAVDALEDCVKQRDLLNNQAFFLGSCDVNTIANIIRVLHEKKDA